MVFEAKIEVDLVYLEDVLNLRKVIYSFLVHFNVLLINLIITQLEIRKYLENIIVV